MWLKRSIVDHRSHNVDMQIKGHFQEAGQPRWAKLRMQRESVMEEQGAEQLFLQPLEEEGQKSFLKEA